MKPNSSQASSISNSTKQSQSWLNIETQSLKNEVSELQRILDEINISSQIQQSQLQSKNYLNLIQTQDSPTTYSSSSSTFSSLKNEPIYNSKVQPPSTCIPAAVSKVSNLKQPTKIVRTQSRMGKSPSSNHKARPASRQQRPEVKAKPDKSCSVMSNRYSNQIKDIDDELSYDQEIKTNQQKKSPTSKLGKDAIEDELQRLRQTLEMVKEQEILLMMRLSQDNQQQQEQEDSSLLVIDYEEPCPDTLRLKQHHRRISRQSFGCRSMQDFRNSFKDDLQSAPQPYQQVPKHPIFSLDIEPCTHETAAMDHQISTPRTNNGEEQAIQNSITANNAMQTPFFSRTANGKKPSLAMGQEEPFGNRIQATQELVLSVQDPNGKLAFNTDRNQTKFPTELSSTPRTSLFQYTSQRSPNCGNQSKSRRNMDYSKMSKHQSIAKLFDNRRYSKKVRLDENNQEIDTKKASPLAQTLSTRGHQQSRNSFMPRDAKIVQTQQHQYLNSTLTPDAFGQRRQSLSKDKYNQVLATQNASHSQSTLLSNRDYTPQSTSRTNLELSVSRQSRAVPPINFPTQGMLSSRSRPGEGASLRKSLHKDSSLVRLRKQELEFEKQEKLKQKVQVKEAKIKTLQDKKSHDARVRREPQTIYEKTLRLKQRADKLQQPFQLLQQSHNTIDTCEAITSLTPMRKSLHRFTNKQQLKDTYDDSLSSRSPFSHTDSNPHQRTLDNPEFYPQSASNRSTKQFNQTNFMNTTQSGHSRASCGNCVKLLSKGLSSSYCPHHNRQLAHTNILAKTSMLAQLASYENGEDLGQSHHVSNISSTTFGGTTY